MVKRILNKVGITRWMLQNMNEVGLIGLIVILYVIFSNTTYGFMSINNQQNILRDASTLGFAAFGATLIIIAGEIDVSVGPAVAFLSVVLSYFLKWSIPIVIAIPLTMGLGVLIGSIAGILKAHFQVPSFVATLGLWSTLRGLALFFTNALPVSFERNLFLDFLDKEYVGIPMSAWIMIVFFLIFLFISQKTTFGRSVYAIGGNVKAAVLVGIPVKRIQILLFGIAGLLATVSSVLLTARLGSGNAGAATGLEFDVIAAVVVGGTALSGGRGTMLGTLLGVFVITLIGNGLVLLGINPFFQEVVRGIIIVTAVLLNIAVSTQGIFRRNI